MAAWLKGGSCPWPQLCFTQLAQRHTFSVWINARVFVNLFLFGLNAPVRNGKLNTWVFVSINNKRNRSTPPFSCLSSPESEVEINLQLSPRHWETEHMERLLFNFFLLFSFCFQLVNETNTIFEILIFPRKSNTCKLQYHIMMRIFCFFL